LRTPVRAPGMHLDCMEYAGCRPPDVARGRWVSRALRFRETPLDEELCLRLENQPGRDPRRDLTKDLVRVVLEHLNPPAESVPGGTRWPRERRHGR